MKLLPPAWFLKVLSSPQKIRPRERLSRNWGHPSHTFKVGTLAPGVCVGESLLILLLSSRHKVLDALAFFLKQTHGGVSINRQYRGREGTVRCDPCLRDCKPHVSLGTQPPTRGRMIVTRGGEKAKSRQD